jgi:hypothetical protein
MTAEQRGRQSHLFTLRLWAGALEEGQNEWRGRVHCVGTDEVRYFRDWPGLIPLLLAMLRDAERQEIPMDLLQTSSAPNDSPIIDQETADGDGPDPLIQAMPGK